MIYDSSKKRLGNELEPSFMKEIHKGFKKRGKNVITRDELQVSTGLKSLCLYFKKLTLIFYFDL